ncbi:hypothetical protein LOD99_5815 [Oopsacas minuta]|uniref:Uncharacterized protein n=1 Tax=Oopsacas minuta TaxID=111878 RepID=A0AAV7JNU3_9METZ|nr:hypothetical protein LOD99_5815 [Oopsacas minuta]
MKHRICISLLCVILLQLLSGQHFVHGQQDGTVRLTEGDNGLVEVYLNGSWGFICDDGWDETDADVTCQILGYPSATQSDTGRYHPDTNYTLLNFYCVGNETSLLDCPHSYYSDYSPGFCSVDEHVYISCAPSIDIIPVITSPNQSIEQTLPSLYNFSQIIECIADGIPTPVVYWSTTTSIEDQVGYNSTLEISSSILTEPTNVFYCVAVNSAGMDVVSVTYNILTSPPTISSPSENITVTTMSNTSDTYECIADGIPKPVVYWSTTTGIEDQVGYNSTLEISSSILTGPTNVFYCVAVNSAGMDVVSVTYNILTSPPTISSPSENITATTIPNTSDSYECIADGIPTPVVYWSTTTNIEDRIGDNSTLGVTSLQLSEQINVFYCVAVSSSGIAVTTVTYNISIVVADVLDNIMDQLSSISSISGETAAVFILELQTSVDSAIDQGYVTEEVLETTASIIEQIVDKIDGSIDTEITMMITNTLGTALINTESLEQPETEAGSLATVSNAEVIALRTLEKFSIRLLEDLLSGEKNVSTVESEFISIINQVIDVSSGDSEEMFNLPLAVGDYPVSATIPFDVAQDLALNGKLAISTSIVYRDQSNTPKSVESYQGSDTLTTSILGKTGKVNFDSEVTLGFDVISVSDGFTLACVYLDGNNWVDDGLTTVLQPNDFTLCKSFHFTSFAVFVTPYDTPDGTATVVLDVFSYILVSISFISLIISLILFCIAGKAFFKVETNIVYFNYCIAMLLATGIFLFGIDTGTFNRSVCMIIAFALHYTWLAVFTWTLCIGILIMFKLVISVMSTRKIYPYLIVFGSVFEVLDRAGFFETELIFNLHSFITSFQKYLQESEITISENRLLETISGYKQSMIKDSLGCTRQCPCCGKFCDRINHEETSCFSSGHKETSCFSSRHQFASMGGNTWGNDKQHSATLMSCEDYSEEMAVALPGRMTTWREFKRSTEREWDWGKDNEILQSELYKRKAYLINLWNKFGKGILEYPRVYKGTRIEFRPYKEKDLNSESGINTYQLCFVIDGTGSMGKDIEKVRDSVQSLVDSYKRTKNEIVFRIVIYPDHCDDKLIDTHPNNHQFISSDESIVTFLNRVIPEGGGDIPEASLDGLAVALNSNWDKGANTRRIIIHLFDAPPHGNFPDYTTHNTNSNPDHCCCCSSKCRYDWQKDVWEKMKELEVEYHGINTGGTQWVEFENTMKKKLDYLCKGFTKCGKEQVNDAVMQIFINYQCEPEDDDEQSESQNSSDLDSDDSDSD